MKNVIWRRRIAVLLTVCMLATQMVIPVFAQSSVSSEETETMQTLDIPSEYKTLEIGKSDAVVDVTAPAKEKAAKKDAATKNDVEKSLETYGSIPIVGNKTASSEEAPKPVVEESEKQIDFGEDTEEVIAHTSETEEGALTLGESKSVHISVVGEAKSYTYEAKEDGGYILSSWVNGEPIGSYVHVYAYNEIGASWEDENTFVYGERATYVDMEEGVTYKFVVSASESQGYVYICLSKAQTISGDTAQIGQAAIYEVEPDSGAVDYVQISVSSQNGETYYVYADGETRKGTSIDFWCPYSTRVYIWKTNASIDTITVSEIQTPMSVIVAEQNQTSLQQTVEVNSNGNGSYVKFVPSVTGTYAFGLQSSDGWCSMGNLYEIKENGLVDIFFSGQNEATCYADFEAGKEYVLRFYGGDGTYTLIMEKTDAVSGTYGAETTVSSTGKYALLTFPAIEKAGVYEVQIKGAPSDVSFQMSGDNGEMGMTQYSVQKAYKDNNGVRSVFLNPCTKALTVLFYTEGLQSNLGNLTVSVTSKDNRIVPDEDDCGKLETTLTTADTRWVSFVPAVSGDYVLTTENKYNNVWTDTQLYELDETGYFYEALASDGTWDNIHVFANLEAGKTYYYKITQSGSESVQSENVNIVIYPVQSVEYSGTESVKTGIRKSVIYTLDVDKVGFYKLNINGADESYLLSIESDNEDVDIVNSFVYKDIPRIFQFTKTGTYQIQVSKELMSDSKDEITFSCSSDAVLELLKDGEYMTVNVENTDGEWIQYVPQQSGWYTLEMQNEDEEYGLSLSVVSEDATEILQQSWCLSEWSGDEVYYTYYLEKDREYYYHVYTWDETTGTVQIKMHSDVKTVTANDTALPEISLSGEEKIVLLSTDFTEEQTISFENASYSSLQMMEITEGYNGEYQYIWEDDILVLPKGAHEYLFYFSESGDRTLTMKKWQPDYSMTASQKFELVGAKSVQWAKFEPQQSGFYSVALTDQSGDAGVDVSTYKMYDTYIGSQSFVDANSKTAYLEAGQTYFFRVEADNIPDGETVTITLNLTEIESEAVLGEGDQVIAMNQVYIAQVDADSDIYYQITTDTDLYKGYKFNWFTKDKNGKMKVVKRTSLSSDVTNITFPSSYQSKGKTLYVLISKKAYTEEKEEFAFGFHKAEYIDREIAYGQKVSEPASNAIKTYTFIPTETGNYSIIIGSNDDEAANMQDYLYINYEGDVAYDLTGYNESLSGSYAYEMLYTDAYTSLQAGKEYTFTIFNSYAYDVRIVKADRRFVYDYDQYNAFFASGGTITLTNEITDDMWDDVDNEQADYIRINDGYLYMDTSSFKNQGDIWFPSYSEFFCAETDAVTYDAVDNRYGGRWWDGFIPKAWYKVDTSNLSKSTKVSLSQKVGNENIILAYREPETVYIQKITLSGVTAMTVGQTAKITATTSTLNKYAPTNPKVIFTSSNPSVVSVDASGNMTAMGAGNATITCKSADGKAQATLSVTVKQNIVRAASVTITGAKDIYVEDEIDLKATIGTNGKGKPTVDGINWSSSNSKVATVDDKGHVVGKAPGTVTITAASKDGYAKQSVEITVKPILAKKVTLSETTIRMKKGSKYKWLEATIKPANTTDQSLTWKSSNKRVATVSKKGVITAKAVGTATITVKTSNGKTDKVKVTVTASNIKVKKITVPKKETLVAGEVLRLKPEVDPINATNSKVSYKSSNEDVATVTNAGVVTAKKPGKATITVTAKDGTGKKATCTVTVKAPDVPKKAAVKSNKKKTATLTWQKVDKADGYVIYMSTSKKGKYKVAATIKKGSTTEYTVKKLKSKKKYYFKVVSYVNVGKKKIYSDESKVINVKVK